MKTYSPYLDDYNYYDPTTYPGKDEFDLDVDLQPMHKQVATDYFGVKVFTSQSIGKQENVASGSRVAVDWTGLASGNYYQWYAVAEDANSGYTRSDIWGFTAGTGPFIPVDPGKPTDPGTPTDPSTPVIPANPFKDVDSHFDWAKDAIAVLADKGIINGTSSTTFEPSKRITRADFMEFARPHAGPEGGRDVQLQRRERERLLLQGARNRQGARHRERHGRQQVQSARVHFASGHDGAHEPGDGA